jgi:hypothetical protein
MAHSQANWNSNQGKFIFLTTIILSLQCHKTRSLELNRHEARKLLVRELDNQINGIASLESIELMKEREKSRLKRKKSEIKYGSSNNQNSDNSEFP